MIRRGIVLLALVYAGCKGHKNCGDGSVAVPSEDPDGGVVCVAEPDDGGDGDAQHPPDARLDGPRNDGPAPFCGDGFCNGTETCSTCSTDCGSCTPVCGDGFCNGTETCSTCSTDCGACPPDAARDASPPDAPPSCPAPQTITSSVSGTIAMGGPNCSTPSCGSTTSSGPDVTYRFTPTVSGSCHANTTNPSTTADTILSIRTSPTGPDIPNACNDDNGMNMMPTLASYVTWTATAFTTYYIVVDTYGPTTVGNYQLTVACP